ncbi:acylneuraminate cytidylyltransferase family protein [Pseudodesulfovibrio portus]|nr:acylneuraminate cytidylyltransferase family protein [Pseudodesulfovibrio portus]
MIKGVVAIIPARGGSKGVFCKNIKVLSGKPLIAWTVEQALASSRIDKVIVSTDDEDIAAVAQDYGAEVPFIRPRKLSGDSVPVGDVVPHAIDFLEQAGEFYKAWLCLLPSHPFRTPDMLDSAAKALVDDGFRSFVTVRPIEVYPGRFLTSQNGVLRSVLSKDDDEATVYYRNYGLVFGKSLSRGLGPSYMYPVVEEAHLVDIDTFDDFAHAELVLKEGKYDYAA